MNSELLLNDRRKVMLIYSKMKYLSLKMRLKLPLKRASAKIYSNLTMRLAVFRNLLNGFALKSNRIKKPRIKTKMKNINHCNHV